MSFANLKILIGSALSGWFISAMGSIDIVMLNFALAVIALINIVIKDKVYSTQIS
jgi:hypothetical protein